MRTRRITTFLLAMIMLFLLFPVPESEAAGTYYQTSKADVPIWSSYSSSSTKITTIGSSGFVLYIVDSVTNSSGNLWYKIGTGSYGGQSLKDCWVYSGNVKSHSHDYSGNGGVCKASGCGYTYPLSVSSVSGQFEVTNTDGAKIWSLPYSTGKSVHQRTTSYGWVINVNGKATNAEGNVWYRLTDGNWVYSGNIKSHTHDYAGNGGVCKAPGCGYTYPLSISSISEQLEVSNTNGAKVWSLPYSTGNSSHKRTESYGWVVNANGKATNAEGHLWFRLTDGNWIFSDNVQPHSHDYSNNGGVCKAHGCGYTYPLQLVSISGQYQYQISNKEGAAVWSIPYSSGSSVIRRTIPYGHVISVDGRVFNAEGNVWVRLTDGNWVYIGNIENHSHDCIGNGGACKSPDCGYTYPLSITSMSGKYEVTNKDGAGVWSTPYSTGSSVKKRTEAYGYVVNVNGKTTNADGNVWYRLTDGCWIYSENVKSHTHDCTGNGGVCKSPGCGYSYPITTTSFSGTFVVTNTSGAKIWSLPYSTGGSVCKRTEAYQAVLSVTGKATNADGNEWYKLSDGCWVYPENVTQRFTVSYNANGGSGAPSAQYFLSGKSLVLSSKKPTRDEYIFQGWGTSADDTTVDYKPGASYSKKSSITLYAIWTKCDHPEYEGGYCTKCGHEYPLTITSISGTFVVTNTDGAPIWTRPYSNRSTEVRTEKYKAVLTVNAKTENQAGNLWYRLSDGNWVYSGNVTQRFTVTYNANGGTGAPAAQTALKGHKLTVSSTKPNYVGYLFKGWTPIKNNSSLIVKPGETITVKSNTTLYAYWETCPHKEYEGGYCTGCGYEYPLTITSTSGTYMVTNPDGAKIWSRPYSTRSTLVRTASVGSVLTINASTINQPGNKWFRLTDGNWVYSENVARCYSITYVLNGGTNGANPAYYKSTDEITLKSATRTGYTFAGWYKESVFNNRITKISQGSTGNVTLYAKWNPNTYTIAFNGNGATSGSLASRTATYDTSLTLPANTFARTAYTFNGWNTRSDGSGTAYSDGATVKNLSSVNGATVTLYAQWKPIPKPTITLQPKSQKVVTDGTATFTVAASGTGLSYRWQWSSDGGVNWKDCSSATTGYNSATIQVTASLSRDGYRYRCKVSNVAGYVLSSSARLDVDDTPVITSQPSNITVGIGGTAKFTVAAKGSNLKYQWQWSKDNGQTWADSGATGATSASFSVSGETYRNGYRYRCKISNSDGTVTSRAATLTVSEKPVIATQPKSVTAGIGGTAKFTVSAQGTGLSYRWQWSSDGGKTWNDCTSATTGYNKATLQVTATETRNGYRYRCKVSNSKGSATSSSATLTVSEKPVIVTQPKSVTAGIGGAAKFTVSAQGTGLSYRWQWSSDSGKSWNDCTSATTGYNKATLQVTATETRSGYRYRCRVSNSKGSATSSSATLTVTEKPVISVQPKNVTVTAGGTAKFTLKVLGNDLKYQWQWSTDGGKTWTNCSSATEGYNKATLQVSAAASRNGYRYRCKVTNSHGSATSSAATLTVSEKPAISTQPKSVTVTVGGTAKFTVAALGTDLKYQWQWSKDDGSTWNDCSSATTGYNKTTLQVSASASRNGYRYRCKVTNSHGSATSSAATLTVSEKPAITTQPKSVTVTVGGTAKFTVAALGADLKYQWQWSKDDGSTWNDCSSATTGYNKTTLQVSAAASRNGYRYRCKVTNSHGSATSSAATLTVSEKPAITTQPKSLTVTVGGTAKITVAALGSDLKYQWQWSKDNGSTWNDCSSATEGYNSSLLKVSATTARNGYQYRCKVSNSHGSATSSAATLTVSEKPYITSQPKNVTVAAGSTAQFKVSALGSDLQYRWQWSKDAGATWNDCSSATSGYNKATLQVSAAESRSGYLYRCVVSNDFGTATSSSAALTVS